MIPATRGWKKAKVLREWCRKALKDNVPILTLCDLVVKAEKACSELDEDEFTKYYIWAMSTKDDR